MKKSEEKIIDFITDNEACSSKDVLNDAGLSVSYATLKRTLSKLVSENYIEVLGQGKGMRYKISSVYELIRPIDMDNYYQQEIDERLIKQTFNFAMITDVLANNNIFSKDELSLLNTLQDEYINNMLRLTKHEFKNELERFAIDLSWKSSQIEGNTYSLLETEKLLKDKETTSGKTKDEAVMLLNHKEAIDFIIATPDYLSPLTVSKIEDVHSILIKELNIERNLRRGRVGISGTNYRPLDNEFQILEAMKNLCELVNNKLNVFEKALLTLVLISYIQPFSDGNKRTARIVSNAVLMNSNYCPISFRTVDSIDYKKALLLFYEQNNISNFKEIFMSQFKFAVKTYF